MHLNINVCFSFAIKIHSHPSGTFRGTKKPLYIISSGHGKHEIMLSQWTCGFTGVKKFHAL